MNPCLWGPLTWQLTQVIADRVRYLEDDKKADRFMTTWLLMLRFLMPCSWCTTTHTRLLARVHNKPLNILSEKHRRAPDRWVRCVWILKEMVTGKLQIQLWLRQTLDQETASAIDRWLYSNESESQLHLDFVGTTLFTRPNDDNLDSDTPDRFHILQLLRTTSANFPNWIPVDRLQAPSAQRNLGLSWEQSNLGWNLFQARIDSAGLNMSKTRVIDILAMFVLHLPQTDLKSTFALQAVLEVLCELGRSLQSHCGRKAFPQLNNVCLFEGGLFNSKKLLLNHLQTAGADQSECCPKRETLEIWVRRIDPFFTGTLD